MCHLVPTYYCVNVKSEQRQIDRVGKTFYIFSSLITSPPLIVSNEIISTDYAAMQATKVCLGSSYIV